MANYHLNISNGSIGKGFPHFNYITGQGKYAKKEKEVIYEKHNIDKCFNSASEFWKTADEKERVNGRVYKEIRLSLVNEFSIEQNKTLLNEFIENELGKDYCYSVAIHEKNSTYGDCNNIHAHLTFSTRKLDGIKRTKESFFKRYNLKNPAIGGAKKNRDWNKVEKLLELRKNWEILQNSYLKTNNINIEVSSESLKKQREVALSNGDNLKAELLNRNPININGYYLKKKTLTSEQKEKLEKFKSNRKIKELKEEVYKLQIERSELEKVNNLEKSIDKLNTKTTVPKNNTNKQNILRSYLRNYRTIAKLNKEKNNIDISLNRKNIEKTSINIITKGKFKKISKKIEELNQKNIFTNTNNEEKKYISNRLEKSKIELNKIKSELNSPQGKNRRIRIEKSIEAKLIKNLKSNKNKLDEIMVEGNKLSNKLDKLEKKELKNISNEIKIQFIKETEVLKKEISLNENQISIKTKENSYNYYEKTAYNVITKDLYNKKIHEYDKLKKEIVKDKEKYENMSNVKVFEKNKLKKSVNIRIDSLKDLEIEFKRLQTSIPPDELYIIIENLKKSNEKVTKNDIRTLKTKNKILVDKLNDTNESMNLVKTLENSTNNLNKTQKTSIFKSVLQNRGNAPSNNGIHRGGTFKLGDDDEEMEL